jgi:hypothetical protein
MTVLDVATQMTCAKSSGKYTSEQLDALKLQFEKQFAAQFERTKTILNYFKGNYIQFIYTNAQERDFNNFCQLLNLQGYIVWRAGPIKNLRYPEHPPKLSICIMKVPEHGVLH